MSRFALARPLSAEVLEQPGKVSSSKTRVTESAQTQEGRGSGKAQTHQGLFPSSLAPAYHLAQLPTPGSISLIIQRSANTSLLRSALGRAGSDLKLGTGGFGSRICRF